MCSRLACFTLLVFCWGSHRVCSFHFLLTVTLNRRWPSYVNLFVCWLILSPSMLLASISASYLKLHGQGDESPLRCVKSGQQWCATTGSDCKNKPDERTKTFPTIENPLSNHCKAKLTHLAPVSRPRGITVSQRLAHMFVNYFIN